MNLSRKRQKAAASWLRAGLGSAVVAAIGAGAWASYGALTRAPDFFPDPVRAGTDVQIPASAYPAPPQEPPPAEPPIQPREPARPILAVAKLPRPRDELRPPQAPALVPVAVNIRPFGVVRVGEGPFSEVELARHELRLPPGRHEVAVSCLRFCAEEPVRKLLEVRPGQANELNVSVTLKRSYVGFEGYPPEATVTVRGESRSVKETRDNPFAISGPAREAKMAHAVEFEVSLPGHKTDTGTASVMPGERVTLRGSLERE